MSNWLSRKIPQVPVASINKVQEATSMMPAVDTSRRPRQGPGPPGLSSTASSHARTQLGRSSSAILETRRAEQKNVED